MPSNEHGVSTIRDSTSHSFPPGIHVPSLTFFDSSHRQEIDWETQSKHFDFLIRSGIHGVVLAGTNGEAIALSRSEKAALVRRTREVAQAAGKPQLPITLGTSGTSTRDVIDDCIAGKEAGADFVLVLVPSFFHFAMSKDAICEFFEEVGDQSPVPVLIYNFPGVAAGLNVDSSMLDRLAKHPNIAGVKLTCGGIAKVTRLSATYPSSQFCALAGQSDWLVPALSVGGTGCVTGVGNLYPKVCLAIYDLYLAGDVEMAQKLQYKLGTAELGFGDGGINGTKWIVGELLGYPEDSRDCRRPYPRFTDKEKQKWISDQVRTIEADEHRLRKLDR
ncbi:aldolase [Hortaea werneckii]|nr:aldolase [Hortaea werneckii]